ncbi:hypothetical protein [Marinobacter sp. DY40_1A1]|uniref:hypothetical protein n=1 Tax=Marinobacter sp. DY40_1A1 TaxID=2583229 RepID=UPI001903C09E|nr:hypothetical protein [Marinobacter sp. DY40_1A1]MBK1885598.1 hypothetical protein [Marinobacter sp. DY40_1A1]
MNHNYVSISFPQEKVKLSDWEVSRIKQAIDNQTAQIKRLITRAITAIGQDPYLSVGAAMAPLQNLQDAHLPEGWFDPDLTYELEELFKYTQNSNEPLEAQDFLDELKAIFWCVDLGGTDGAKVVQQLNANLNKLVELSDNGLCHSIAGHWVVGSAEPDDHDDRSNHELWRLIHQVAALPLEVRLLLCIGLPGNDELPAKAPACHYLSMH